jgi:signal transduction histidine kinase
MTNYLEELSQDEIREFSSSIYKSASGVYKLIENLLQWSRLQLGRIDFVPQKFKFGELASEMRQLYQASADNKKIFLEDDVEPGLMVLADRHMAETVLRNLISNAIKFTSRYGRIRLIAKRENGTVKITVKDDGRGMDSLQLSKLFSLSEHRSTMGTDQEKGTGLGLLICKEFVEKNGGMIVVESKPELGSSFTFTLPAA